MLSCSSAPNDPFLINLLKVKEVDKFLPMKFVCPKNGQTFDLCSAFVVAYNCNGLTNVTTLASSL